MNIDCFYLKPTLHVLILKIEILECNLKFPVGLKSLVKTEIVLSQTGPLTVNN